jgi:hypothetical protein
MSVSRQEQLMSRSHEARVANDHIAEVARRLRFVSRVPMHCECSDESCQELFLIPLEHYAGLRARGYLTAPDHRVDHYRPSTRGPGYWVHTLANE